jgi:hypothetical protein
MLTLFLRKNRILHGLIQPSEHPLSENDPALERPCLSERKLMGSPFVAAECIYLLPQCNASLLFLALDLAGRNCGGWRLFLF